MSSQIRTQLSDLLNSNTMHGFIIAIVLCNGVVLGLRTEPTLEAHLGEFLSLLDNLTIGLLIGEVLLRFMLTGSHFFKRGWNIFDAVILSLSVFAILYNVPVLAALRIMLLFRIIELIPTMKHVVEAIKRAVEGLTNAVILLLVVFYTFSVAATHLFGTIAGDHFGNVGRAMFTLFQVMAFDNLGDIIRPLMEKQTWAWAFFVVFLILTAFSILNLFIGIIVQAMQDASNALAKHKKVTPNTQSAATPPAATKE
ncbi:MAG: hypothetical protein C0514_00255 [Candidatus Puniceispirillum sp.]|nr:hypothetical protein [Candidatus Puniceispirillum sp.]